MRMDGFSPAAAEIALNKNAIKMEVSLKVNHSSIAACNLCSKFSQRKFTPTTRRVPR